MARRKLSFISGIMSRRLCGLPMFCSLLLVVVVAAVVTPSWLKAAPSANVHTWFVDSLIKVQISSGREAVNCGNGIWHNTGAVARRTRQFHADAGRDSSARHSI